MMYSAICVIGRFITYIITRNPPILSKLARKNKTASEPRLVLVHLTFLLHSQKSVAPSCLPLSTLEFRFGKYEKHFLATEETPF